MTQDTLRITFLLGIPNKNPIEHVRNKAKTPGNNSECDGFEDIRNVLERSSEQCDSGVRIMN